MSDARLVGLASREDAREDRSWWVVWVGVDDLLRRASLRARISRGSRGVEGQVLVVQFGLVGDVEVGSASRRWNGSGRCRSFGDLRAVAVVDTQFSVWGEEVDLWAELGP